jgi:hypothetical protein
MTTWGEAWSYWTVHDCYEISHSSTTIANQTIIEFESLVTEQCTAVSPLAWNVPMTWILDVQGNQVVEIRDSNSTLTDLTGVKKTAEGYTQSTNESLHLSLIRGHNVSIVVDGTVNYDVVGRSQFWNNYSAAVTIAAHDTSDLFKWSKRFTDEPQLVFTWLVQPRDGIAESGWLPFLVLTVALSTITGMMLILKKEGLGPFAEKVRRLPTGTEEVTSESKFEAE